MPSCRAPSSSHSPASESRVKRRIPQKHATPRFAVCVKSTACTAGRLGFVYSLPAVSAWKRLSAREVTWWERGASHAGTGEAITQLTRRKRVGRGVSELKGGVACGELTAQLPNGTLLQGGTSCFIPTSLKCDTTQRC